MAKKAKSMPAALRAVEKTTEDKKRDKKKGYGEGSAADMKDDKAHAKRLIKKSKK